MKVMPLHRKGWGNRGLEPGNREELDRKPERLEAGLCGLTKKKPAEAGLDLAVAFFGLAWRAVISTTVVVLALVIITVMASVMPMAAIVVRGRHNTPGEHHSHSGQRE
jgi:cell division septal protein FtsQ